MAGQLSDAVLRRAGARAAEPTGLLFTENQLYYEVCRTLAPAQLVPRQLSFTVPPIVPRPVFDRALRAHGPVEGLLPPPSSGHPAVTAVEPDLYDYALPRLLICQSAAVAGMLRANGLPMESACPVVAVDDLPLDEGIVRMLGLMADTDDAASVYVLHDDSPTGHRLPSRIRELTDLPDHATIVPIGLRRSQTAPLHLARTGLLPARTVEVEAVPPAMLLRSVHRLVRDVHRRTEPLVDMRAARSAGFLTWPMS